MAPGPKCVCGGFCLERHLDSVERRKSWEEIAGWLRSSIFLVLTRCDVLPVDLSSCRPIRLNVPGSNRLRDFLQFDRNFHPCQGIGSIVTALLDLRHIYKETQRG